jgi:hypothetical protein
MPEFNIRTDSVDVEQIMRQIRARIKEKRGVDYTEQQIQELANVKLERFLDPKGVRSDLVEQFKRSRGVSPEPPNYGFEDTTLYETHRGIVRLIRKLLHPILKLFFNPNALVHVLHMQGQINNINAQHFRVREELDALYYEVIHNLVLEVTRLGIETKNLKMRVESLNSRIDFDERRARALEGVVQYRPGTGPSREPPHVRASSDSGRTQPPAQTLAFQEPGPTPPPGLTGAPLGVRPGEESGQAESSTVRRRRRRRRGRRGGRGRGPGIGQPPDAAGAADMSDQAVHQSGEPEAAPDSGSFDADSESGDTEQ